MAFFIMIFMFAAWTNVFPLGKMTLQYCPPVFLTSARMIFAGILLLAFLWLKNKNSLKVTKKQFLSLTLLGIFSIYLTNVFEFWSLQHLSAAKTCFIYSLSPFFSAFFSYIHFGEKMNPKKWLGFAIGSLGFIPVLFLETGSERSAGSFFIFSWPELAMIGAALCSVYGWVLLRLVVKDSNVSPLMANGTSMLIGGFFALIHSFFIDAWTPIPIKDGGVETFVKGIILMTVISNILCYNLYGYLLKKYTATFLSFVGLLSPIFASLSGWLLLGEVPSLTILLSTSIVVLGLWIVYQAELKQGYILTKKSEPAEA